MFDIVFIPTDRHSEWCDAKDTLIDVYDVDEVCVCVFNPAAFFTGSRRTHMWLQRAPHPSRAAEEASHTYTHNHTPLVCCCCGYVWQDEDSSRPSIHHPMSFQHVTYTHRKHLTHILGRSTISLLQLIKAVM